MDPDQGENILLLLTIAELARLRKQLLEHKVDCRLRFKIQKKERELQALQLQ